MPEYPDIVVYIERLRSLVQGHPLQELRVAHPFVLRTASPPVEVLAGRTLREIKRLGKRIVFAFTEEYFLVLHLMIMGRLLWRQADCAIPAKRGLAALDFSHGTLLLTESSSQKRASLHLMKGQVALQEFDRGGLEVLEATPEAFAAAIRAENHTLKRVLTDPHILSGIDNAYSDEMLHRARLSPFLQTRGMTDEEIARLYAAVRAVLIEWTERLRKEVGGGFPERVVSSREGMAVHGRYGQPCPMCGTPIQRIRYATNETNYCPQCQTEGRLLADRSLSRLLKQDWPRTIEELEERKGKKPVIRSQ